MSNLNSFRAAIRTELTGASSPLIADVEKAFRQELEALIESGTVSLGPPERLTGFALECFVKNLLADIGFQPVRGRPGLEDFTVTPPPNVGKRKPLVVEVKSSRRPNLARSDLRQLDDWVFDLSGEETARKHGLKTGGPFVTGGLGLVSAKHPTPHKGVMIFNGPVGLSFSERSSCASQSEVEFAKKRDFCLISLDKLIELNAKVAQGTLDLEAAWVAIQSTEGLIQI